MSLSGKNWLIFIVLTMILYIVLCVFLWSSQNSPQYMRDASIALVGGLAGGLAYDRLKKTFGED